MALYRGGRALQQRTSRWKSNREFSNRPCLVKSSSLNSQSLGKSGQRPNGFPRMRPLGHVMRRLARDGFDVADGIEQARSNRVKTLLILHLHALASDVEYVHDLVEMRPDLGTMNRQPKFKDCA